MIKDILFDLDGTLTDPMTGITKSVQYALKSFGIEVKDNRELEFFIGPPLGETFMKYYGFSEEQAKIAVEKYREYFAPTGIFENEVYSGIPQMLSRPLFPTIMSIKKPPLWWETAFLIFRRESKTAF